MTGSFDAPMQQDHSNDLFLMCPAVDATTSAVDALTVALRFADGSEIDALLTLSRHQQSALRQLTAH